MVGLASASHYCLVCSINSIYSEIYIIINYNFDYYYYYIIIILKNNFDDNETDEFCQMFESRCNKEGSSLSKFSGSGTVDEGPWIGRVTVEHRVHAQLSDIFALTKARLLDR